MTMYSRKDELPLAARAGAADRSTIGPEVRVQQDNRDTWRQTSGTEGLETLMRDASRHRGLSAVSRDLGHELKSVLNVVTLNLALLSRVAATGQPTRADLELAARSSDVMRRELKRLDTYIDGVLRAHARDDEGWQRLDLCACCQRIGLLIGARAARQRVTVRINTPETEVFIDACPAQLQNALVNLVINALDAMPNGGTLDLQVAVDGPVARVRVSDSGPGLSDTIRSDPWQPRQTADGLGVGLSVSKAIVDAHDGRIAYHRPSGTQGASFTLEFTRLTVR